MSQERERREGAAAARAGGELAAQSEPAAPVAAPAAAPPAEAREGRRRRPCPSATTSSRRASVSIFAGESITWRNNGQAQHSATANDGSFDTGVFGPGASRSESFASPGTFSYYCVVHGLSQSGTVNVASASRRRRRRWWRRRGQAPRSGTSEAAAVASPSRRRHRHQPALDGLGGDRPRLPRPDAGGERRRGRPGCVRGRRGQRSPRSASSRSTEPAERTVRTSPGTGSEAGCPDAPRVDSLHGRRREEESDGQ